MKQQTLLSILPLFLSRSSWPALIHKQERSLKVMRYGELHRIAFAVADQLDEWQLKKGERVLLWGQNSPEWVCTFIGCLIQGLIPVPIDPRSTESWVRKIAIYTEATSLISDMLLEMPWHGRSITFERLRQLAESRPPRDRRETSAEASDPAAIFFTSGTTGNPKGTVLSHANIDFVVRTLFDQTKSLDQHEKWLSLLPLSHIFEQVIGLWLPLRRGDSITYLDKLKGAAIFHAFQEDHITLVAIVPRLLKLMQKGILNEIAQKRREIIFDFLLRFSKRLPLNVRRRIFPQISQKLGGLKFFIVGGSVLETSLEEFWRGVGIPILQGYGLTESTGVIACNLPSAMKSGTLGKPLPGIEVRLAADKEILVKGQNVFQGYYQDPIKTAEILEEGWLKTQDLGEWDEDGFLHFRGRKKDVIVTGSGLNIYPEDVEAILNNIKGIKESCVVGIQKEKGETVHAALLLENFCRNPNEAIEEANRRLENKQRVEDFSIWWEDDFPRTSTMKVRKDLVQDRIARKGVYRFSRRHQAPSQRQAA